ncbi:MAG: hypothetical protein VYC91_05095 [Acidobacteriota bacterium]|nr:hypothetical protein [Acidobacteriota bacterium]
MTRILGISAYYHDSAACLLEEGLIVESPQQAYQCFMGTRLDFLIIENCFLYKKEQKKWSSFSREYTVFYWSWQGDGPGHHIRVALPFFSPPPGSPVPVSSGLCPLARGRWWLA